MRSTLSPTVHRTLIAALLATFPGAAFGQSINIDFGALSGGPDGGYAAAGSAGYWNLISPSEGQTIGAPVESCLMDVDGQACAATVLVPEIDPGLTDDQATSGNEQTLVDDYLPGLLGFDIPIQFRNLSAGRYEVMTYAWKPAQPDWESSVTVGDLPAATGTSLGGAWPGALAEGVTHAIHTVNVLDGALVVRVSSADTGTAPVINGVQIRRLDQMIGDTNGDGQVNVDDLTNVLIGWTTPGHGCDGIQGVCPGDVNGDSAVDIDDLILVLLYWTG